MASWLRADRRPFFQATFLRASAEYKCGHFRQQTFTLHLKWRWPEFSYIAYPLLTVTEESAGGAEQVLWTLEREMAGRGTLTTVAASAGSRASGELFSTGEPCIQPDDYERRRSEHEDRVVDLVWRRVREGRAFDLIHDKSGSFWRRAAEIDTPVLATLHLPRSFYPPGSFQDVAANVSFNCVSDSQARSFADLSALAGVVATALLWIVLSRTLARARNATRIGVKGCSGWGGSVKKRRRTWRWRSPPALDYPSRSPGRSIRFLTTSNISRGKWSRGCERMPNARLVCSPPAELKRRLLLEAKALLITSLAEETSSLVAMEAAASGTPVIAFRRGALAEVVRDGVTGFLVEGVADAAPALQQLSRICPVACARHARENFSASKMADQYSRLYERLAIRKFSDYRRGSSRIKA